MTTARVFLFLTVILMAAIAASIANAQTPTVFGTASSTSFTPGLASSAGVVPVDLDQDGDIDFLTGGPSSFVSTILNIGGSYLLGPILPVAASPLRIAVADVDQDGDPDILSDSGATISILLNLGTTVSRTDYASVSTTAGVQFVDFNGDGFVDILVGALHVRFGNGTGAFGPQVPLGLPTSISVGRQVLVIDLDGDSQKDIVYVGGAPGLMRRIEIYTRPTGAFALAFSENIPTGNSLGGYSGVAAGDFDQDGVVDLVVAESDNQCGIRTYRRFGSTYVVWQTFPLVFFGDETTRSTGVIVRDIDQDGDDDVVTIVNNGQTNGLTGTHTCFVFHGMMSGLILGQSGVSGVSGTLNSPNLVDVAGGSGLDLVGVSGSAMILTSGSLVIRPNNLMQGSPVPAYELSLIDGNQSIMRGTAPTLPLAIRVVDAVNGQSAQGITVSITASNSAISGGFAYLSPTAVTDANGIAVFTPVTQPISAPIGSTAVVTASLLNAAPLGVGYFIDGLFDALSNFPSSGTSIFSLTFRYDRAGLPLIVAADSPPPTPIATSYGSVATSIFSPGPSLFILDGIGVFGPPDPTLVTVTSPNGIGSLSVSGTWSLSVTYPTVAIQGQTFVFQIYAYDPVRPGPLAVIISNAVLRTF